MSSSLLKTLKPKAARFCAYRERSVSEVRTKLKTLGASETAIETLIKELIAENFINESRYAHAFASDKFRFNKWGKVKIRQQLRQKQLDEDEIDQALDNLPVKEYHEMIQLLIEQKLKGLSLDLEDGQKKQKVIRFLLQKGFEYDLIAPHLRLLS